MKRKRIFCLFFLVSILLCGCGMRTVEEMYSIPKRSPEFKNLQTVIDTAMADMDYAAPISGDNRQSVQMADLDGDGVEEYIVFARDNTESPLRILVVRQLADEKYEIMDAITCKGTAFEQVQYADFDGKPGCELIVGRSISDQMSRVASVYSFASGEPDQILSAIYYRYAVADMDSDGQAELMVIRSGEAEDGKAVAMLYSWKNDAIERSVEASLSEEADQIRRITLNRLAGGEPAVYVASIHNATAVVTDVLAMNGDSFTNVALRNASGTDVQTLRNHFVYGEDIDGDSILELPALIPMRYAAFAQEAAQQHLVRWYDIGLDGSVNDKLYTFHNFTGGWYMELRSNWLDRLTVEQNGASYTFYIWNENYQEALAVFTILSLTDKDRDSQASVQNRFALYRGDNVVYAGKLESASAIYGITEEYMVESFHVIRQDWKNGET